MLFEKMIPNKGTPVYIRDVSDVGATSLVSEIWRVHEGRAEILVGGSWSRMLNPDGETILPSDLDTMPGLRRHHQRSADAITEYEVTGVTWMLELDTKGNSFFRGVKRSDLEDPTFHRNWSNPLGDISRGKARLVVDVLSTVIAAHSTYQHHRIILGPGSLGDYRDVTSIWTGRRQRAAEKSFAQGDPSLGLRTSIDLMENSFDAKSGWGKEKHLVDVIVDDVEHRWAEKRGLVEARMQQPVDKLSDEDFAAAWDADFGA